MEIIKATYGGVDCTEEIKNKIIKNELVIKSNNSIIGDPIFGVVKYLEIEAKINNTIIQKRVKEGDLLILSETNYDRLGIFYSNNINEKTYPTIRKSLNTIKKAAEGKADILTCMWFSEPENPFYEYIAWTKTISHLNQVLQILQLLYTAKEMKNYKYVSFLEHDVLYAEGYFDYPDFDGGVLSNKNYIGMIKDGYQYASTYDNPLSQLTMKFDDAIKHFESILPNALVTNDGQVEPKHKIISWESKWPNIHINHGIHFTGHFLLYKKDDLFYENTYWGNNSKYHNLFFD